MYSDTAAQCSVSLIILVLPTPLRLLSVPADPWRTTCPLLRCITPHRLEIQVQLVVQIHTGRLLQHFSLHVATSFQAPEAYTDLAGVPLLLSCVPLQMLVNCGRAPQFPACAATHTHRVTPPHSAPPCAVKTMAAARPNIVPRQAVIMRFWLLPEALKRSF